MAGEVTYQPSEADYVAAHRDWFTNLIRRRGLSTMASAAFAAAVIMAAIGYLSGDTGPALIVTFVAGLFVGPFAVLARWGLSYALLPGRARRLFRQHRSLQKEFTYGWSDVGLTYHSTNGSGQIVWADLHRQAEEKHTFLFYLTDNLFHFVPRRALTDSEAADLCSLIATVNAQTLR